MKFKKLSALLLSGLMLFSSCQSAPKTEATSKTAEDKTIHLWHLWTSETDAMKIATEKAVNEYMEKNKDLKIEIHMLENEAFKTKISTEFAGSAKGIDLFFYWGGGRAAKLANANKLLPVGDYISDDVKSKIKDGASQNFEYDGKMYAVPIYSWSMLLYCNKDLFEKAGAKIPENYTELLEACKKLSEAGITPIAQGIKEGWQAAFVYEALALRDVGADNVNAMLSQKAGFEDPGYLSAAEKVVELNSIGAFGKNPFEIGSADADAMFFTEKAAMRLTGNWITEQIMVDKNSIVKEDGKIVAVPIPMTDSKNAKATDYAGGFIDALFVNKETKYPQEVVDLSVYLSQELAKVRHESGQGFTGWNLPVDESKLSSLAKQVASVADKNVNGVIAWDTSLNENAATTHLEAVQALFLKDANVNNFVEEHKTALENK